MAELVDKKIKAEFDKLVVKVKNGDVSKTPSINDKLKLYAWYKQALFGDIPSSDLDKSKDFTEKMKQEAWVKVKGMKKNEAMSLYIDYFK